MKTLNIICIVSPIILCSCSSDSSHEVDGESIETFEEKYERERKDALITAQSAIAQLVDEHGAVSGRKWRKQFSTYGHSRYTIHVQDAVKALKHQPIVLIMDVVDLFRKNDAHYLLCEDAYETYFLLRCDAQVSKTILDSPVDEDFFRETYAIVARLREVSLLYERYKSVGLDIPFHELDITAYDGELIFENSEEVTRMAEQDAYVEEGSLYPKLYVLGECIGVVRLADVDLYDLSLLNKDLLDAVDE